MNESRITSKYLEHPEIVVGRTFVTLDVSGRDMTDGLSVGRVVGFDPAEGYTVLVNGGIDERVGGVTQIRSLIPDTAVWEDRATFALTYHEADTIRDLINLEIERLDREVDQEDCDYDVDAAARSLEGLRDRVNAISPGPAGLERSTNGEASVNDRYDFFKANTRRPGFNAKWALTLARAEALYERAHKAGVASIDWNDDPDLPGYWVSLNVNDEVEASLGGIILDGGDPWKRVVEAELALDAEDAIRQALIERGLNLDARQKDSQ